MARVGRIDQEEGGGEEAWYPAQGYHRRHRLHSNTSQARKALGHAQA